MSEPSKPDAAPHAAQRYTGEGVTTITIGGARQMTPDVRQEVDELAREVMGIVLDVAARRLKQTVGEIHDSRIEPLRRALEQCQTLTPSLMEPEACRERLKEINQYVYAVLEGRVQP